MKTYARFVFLAVFLPLFATPAFADAVCDHLMGDQYSPGLFGLCNAYCVAQDCDSYAPEDQPNSCKRLLINWDRKATGDNDPEMPPCLDEEVSFCPCWATDVNPENGLSDEIEATDGYAPLGCGSGDPATESNLAIYFNEAFELVLFQVDPFEGFHCTYSVGEASPAMLITEDEYQDCLAEVQSLQDVDFGNDCQLN